MWLYLAISLVQFSSVTVIPTLCNPMDCSTPGFLVPLHLLELVLTHIHWVGDAIQTSHCLSSNSPALNLFQHQGLFQWVGPLKVLEFQLQHQSFQWYSGLISFRIDWFDLLPFQGTLKNLLQHYSLRSSIVWHSVLFMVQLSHQDMTTGKTIALTIWAFFLAKWFLCFLKHGVDLS